MDSDKFSKLYFRHDKLREHQKDLIADVYDVVSNKKHLIAHAPTGIGKTDSVLGASLTYALENDLTVFFLTPKISQHKIAVDVVRGIAKKYDVKIRGVDLVGRRYMCIDQSLGELDHESFYQSCEKKRRNEECTFYGNSKGYEKLGEAKANTRFTKLLETYGAIKTHGEILKQGEQDLACPYEWLIKLAGVSNVIIADYFHLMIPGIRDIFLAKTKKSMDKSIVIIDEAHNLSKRIRDQLSTTVNSFMLSRAEKEMKVLGVEPLRLSKVFETWARRKLGDNEELLILKGEFDEAISKFDMTREDLATYLEVLGANFIERTNKKSACLKIATFIKRWGEDEPGSIRLLKRKDTYSSLSKRFLDSSPATNALNQMHSAILMSGTLMPLEMHRDIIGLDKERTVMKKYPSPFEQSNTINIIVDGMTTKYSKRNFEQYRTIAEKIDNLISLSPPGVALFFPSYVVMNSITPLIKAKRLLMQDEKMDPKEITDLIAEFSRGSSILCAVQGGSLSEGIDYANSEIKTAIIIGIALEEMNLEIESLIDYYQEKFGKGWEYGYTYPGVTKALQAAGRCIRKESDRAALIFMDERFKWKNYSAAMDGRRFIVTDQPEQYVERFWNGK
ncbi:MAG: ATP-dependent DNA helicase [Candidatus Micrarchaeota archaeon]|nr:ATP-dependent DNA helicase [Candidatus Micrarchaeota archaeon]